LRAFGFDAEQEGGQIDWRQDGDGEKEADEQFARRAEIGEGVAVENCMRPQMLADFGREPESVEAEGDDFEKRAFAQDVAKFIVAAGEDDTARLRRVLRRANSHIVHEKPP
jgi:hypothetical protein